MPLQKNIYKNKKYKRNNFRALRITFRNHILTAKNCFKKTTKKRNNFRTLRKLFSKNAELLHSSYRVSNISLNFHNIGQISQYQSNLARSVNSHVIQILQRGQIFFINQNSINQISPTSPFGIIFLYAVHKFSQWRRQTFPLDIALQKDYNGKRQSLALCCCILPKTHCQFANNSR